MASAPLAFVLGCPAGMARQFERKFPTAGGDAEGYRDNLCSFFQEFNFSFRFFLSSMVSSLLTPCLLLACAFAIFFWGGRPTGFKSVDISQAI